MKELKDERKFLKKGENKFIWKQEYESEMTLEEAQKIKKNLQENVDSLKNMIEGVVPEKETKEAEVAMEVKREAYRDALQNMDKYINQEINNLKKKKKEIFSEMRKFLQNYEEEKDKHVRKKQEQVENYLEKLYTNLEEQKKHLKEYEKVGI